MRALNIACVRKVSCQLLSVAAAKRVSMAEGSEPKNAGSFALKRPTPREPKRKRKNTIRRNI